MMNIAIGIIIIQNSAHMPDIAAIIPPVGSVALVVLVAFAATLAAIGITPLTSESTELPASPMYRPVKNVKTATMTREYEGKRHYWNRFNFFSFHT